MTPPKAYVDLHQQSEDERIETIVATVTSARTVCAVVVDDMEKADRYIGKFGDRIQVIDKTPGGPGGSVVIRVGPKGEAPRLLTYWAQVVVGGHLKILVVDAGSYAEAAGIVAAAIQASYGAGVYDSLVMQIDEKKLDLTEPLNTYNLELLKRVPRNTPLTRDDIANTYGLAISEVPPGPGVTQPLINNPNRRH